MEKITILFNTIFKNSTNKSKTPSNKTEINSSTISYEFQSGLKECYEIFYTTPKGYKRKVNVNSNPWIKEIKYDKIVLATIISINGESKTAHHKVKLAIKKDGKNIDPDITLIANNSGCFSKTNPKVVFYKD